MKTEPNETAYPATQYYDEQPIEQTPGLTKREYFAAMIMQGVAANGQSHSHWSDQAERAVKIADYLIQALNKES